MNTCCIGIDVSKDAWDVAQYGKKRVERFATTAEGLQALLAWLEPLQPGCIAMEATGGWEKPLLRRLQQEQYPVAVLNPRRVRDFAKAHNQLAKTDRIDARILAQFAAQMGPAPTPPPDENTEKLKELRVRRSQVVDVLTQEKNRLATQRNPALRKLVQQAIDFYQKQRDVLDQQIEESTKCDAQLRARVELLTTVPGVGLTTAAALVAELPEIGQLNRQQAARLAGLAPINRDSGQFRGRRMIGGGRTTVRTTLYMATLVATRFNPRIRDHYQHLLAQGKRKLVALVACMRKLLLILNAMIKNQTPWKSTFNA